MRFIAGVADAIKKAKRWADFIIESLPGQALEKGKTIEDLRGELNVDNIPDMVFKANPHYVGKVGRTASGSSCTPGQVGRALH